MSLYPANLLNGLEKGNFGGIFVWIKWLVREKIWEYITLTGNQIVHEVWKNVRDDEKKQTCAQYSGIFISGRFWKIFISNNLEQNTQFWIDFSTKYVSWCTIKSCKNIGRWFYICEPIKKQNMLKRKEFILDWMCYYDMIIRTVSKKPTGTTIQGAIRQSVGN